MQSLLPDTIHLPRAVIRDRALLIDPNATDDDVLKLATRLVSVAGYAHWALAAALGELLMRKYRAELSANSNPDTQDAKDKAHAAAESWLNEFCIAQGLKPKLRRELLAVHTFYPPDARTFDLTYEHYRDAMLIASDGKPRSLPRALDTLASAHDARWSVSELRRHARTAASVEAPTPPAQTALFDDYHAVEAFARFIHAALPRLASWTPDRIRLVHDELREVREFIDRLDALNRLNGWHGTPTPGHKESFTPKAPI